MDFEVFEFPLAEALSETSTGVLMNRARITPLDPRELGTRNFETLVFAGGGNRCWWQAGLVGALCQGMGWLPRRFIGVSAGAAIATAYACGRIEDALRDAVAQFDATPRNVEWRHLLSATRPFVLPAIYSRWIDSFLDAGSLDCIRRNRLQVEVGITRPIPLLPLAASATLALLLYVSEKFWLRGFHARLPHRLGFRAQYFDLAACGNVSDARSWLLASAAAVPVTPAYRIAGSPALDGGFYDSVPRPPREADGLGALVLLTRHKPGLPQVFAHDGAVYIQPLAPVAATNLDCTSGRNVLLTYEQGLREAQQLVAASRYSPRSDRPG